MPARECDETFRRRRAMSEICFQDSLDRPRRILGLDVAIQFASKRGIWPEAAADQHVVALDRIGILIVLHLAGQEADLGNEVLRARMMAAGQMDIDGRVKRNARLAPLGDVFGMPLGVGGGELATGIAGAGDKARPKRIGLDRETKRCDVCLRSFEFVGWHTGDQQVLPDGEPDVAVTQFACDLGKPPHLGDAEIADRHNHANPVQTLLFLRVDTDVGSTREWRPWRQRAEDRAVELASELFLHKNEKFLDPHFVEHVFKSRLVAVGTIAVVYEYTHHCIGHRCRIRGPDDDAGVAGKTTVACKPAEAKTEPDAGLKPESVVYLHRLETDIISVFQHGYHARAVEPDVEFSRQTVERSVVENMEMPFTRIRARVDQLLRIDSGGRRLSDVADIVGTGSARAKAEVLDRLDHGDGIFRLDLADLDIRPRCDVSVAAAISFGEVGEPGELGALQNTVRQSQAA